MSDTRPVPAFENPPAVSRRDVIKRRIARDWKISTAFVAVHRNARILTLEIVGALTVLVGIAQYSVPIALIVGGVGAVVAAERQ